MTGFDVCAAPSDIRSGRDHFCPLLLVPREQHVFLAISAGIAG